MEPYDQRREDPRGFYLSLAVVAGLVAIGGFISGGHGQSIAILAGLVAGFCITRMRTNQ